MTAADDLRPGPFDVAAGMVLGEVDAPPAPPGPRVSALRALEDAVVPALAQPPCLVAFSGGRDSSAILAAAVTAARREGLDPPVAVTQRFASGGNAEESEWQELVVGHLRVADWERIDLVDELDYLGDLGAGILRDLGVLWPPNLAFNAPMLERARGGTLLAGYGGDELLGGGTFGRLRAIARRRLRPEPRDARKLARALAPLPMRRARVRKTSAFAHPWLRYAARREIVARAARYLEDEPVRGDVRIRWMARRRHLAATRWSNERLAARAGARYLAPLLDARFVEALARAGGARGFGTRTEVMRAVFGEVLPDALLARPRKAEFGAVFWGPRTRAFMAAWEGEGVDPALVDADALRRAWDVPNPTFYTAMLLQTAWYAAAPACARPPNPLE